MQETLKPGQQWLTPAFCLSSLIDHIMASLTLYFLNQSNKALELIQGQQVCVFMVERIWREAMRVQMAGGKE